MHGFGHLAGDATDEFAGIAHHLALNQGRFERGVVSIPLTQYGMRQKGSRKKKGTEDLRIMVFLIRPSDIATMATKSITMARRSPNVTMK